MLASDLTGLITADVELINLFFIEVFAFSNRTFMIK
jgi:hypothetical protein